MRNKRFFIESEKREIKKLIEAYESLLYIDKDTASYLKRLLEETYNLDLVVAKLEEALTHTKTQVVQEASEPAEQDVEKDLETISKILMLFDENEQTLSNKVTEELKKLEVIEPIGFELYEIYLNRRQNLKVTHPILYLEYNGVNASIGYNPGSRVVSFSSNNRPIRYLDLSRVINAPDNSKKILKLKDPKYKEKVRKELYEKIIKNSDIEINEEYMDFYEEFLNYLESINFWEEIWNKVIFWERVPKFNYFFSKWWDEIKTKNLGIDSYIEEINQRNYSYDTLEVLNVLRRILRIG